MILANKNESWKIEMVKFSTCRILIRCKVTFIGKCQLYHIKLPDFLPQLLTLPPYFKYRSGYHFRIFSKSGAKFDYKEIRKFL